MGLDKDPQPSRQLPQTLNSPGLTSLLKATIRLVPVSGPVYGSQCRWG